MGLDINLEVIKIKHSLKTKLSLTIIFVVLITVALISILSNFFIQGQFKDYISREQEKMQEELVNNISKQYDKSTNSWNIDQVHVLGMGALYDKYIIKVYDLKNSVVWNAEDLDRDTCLEVMENVSHSMMIYYPNSKGEFISKTVDIESDNEKVGTVDIKYYGPFFLEEDDFQFLNSLNTILIGVGLFSLLFSVLVGVIIAKRLSDPINKAADTAKQISDGYYNVRIKKETNTKEVGELISSINNLAFTLEKQEKLRKQLTADIAHEFRTPLTTLQTHMEAMIEGIWKPEIYRLESCHVEIIRIIKMVKDLERLATVENDNFKLNKTEINLADIVEKIIGNFDIHIKNKGLAVSITGNSSNAFADKDRISQVIINLITNAVKYTNEGGAININISESNKFVSLSIKDNGIGIQEKEIPFVFERFYRGDKSRNKSTGGSGIGLAIVKSIVMAHEGKIELESELGKGSCFTIKLPR